MAREIETATVDVLKEICGGPLPTPDWLLRPGLEECGSKWELVCEMYERLTGLQLPNEMRRVERRTVDGVFEFADRGTFILEVDESQHFNGFRATTLRCYPEDLPLAFDRADWIRRCDRKTNLAGVGFATPRPPLFPGDNGRHRQRAFRDALADLLPSVHGFLPTLRLGDFELGGWIERRGPAERMERLLRERFGDGEVEP
jgi:hypothetical protein